MSEWTAAVCGFAVGASIASLIWTFWTMQEVPRTKHLSCRACGSSFMGPHPDCPLTPAAPKDADHE